MRFSLTRALVPAAIACLALTVAAPPASSAPATFQHPGVLVSKAQLDFVRSHLTAEPWKSAFAKMKASPLASLSYTPKPRAVVECGPSSNPNHGCSDERGDALAAYTDALMWYLTRDARYAKKAIQIMDAWSATLTAHTNHNAPLQTGWSGASFSRAAELIKHTYTSWPNAGRFATLLRTVYLPTVIKGAPGKNGNWELIMTDAAIGIAVFLDDRAAFDKAVALWRGRLPAYIYLKSDGAQPKQPPGAKVDIVKYWQGQKTFVDGLAQETCRDFGHTGWGIEAAIHVAETARIQGLDLYAEGGTRLRLAMGFHSAYELGEAVPSWLCGGTLKTGLGPTFEVGYNALANRLHNSMPRTLKVVQKYRPAGANYFLAWETLTHAANPN